MQCSTDTNCMLHQPNYSAMAVYFGQGATYDTMQGRFRTYRRMSEDMRAASPQGKATSTPSRSKKGSTSTTPRKSKGGVTKSPKKSRASRAMTETPTKKGKGVNANLIRDIIELDDDEIITVKDETDTTTTKLALEDFAGNIGRPVKAESSLPSMGFGIDKEDSTAMGVDMSAYIEVNENVAQWNSDGISTSVQGYDEINEPQYGGYFMA